MTTSEFRDQFNLLYDNIASKAAPGLDDYEISVFLTYAQEQLVKTKDSDKRNSRAEGFENSEKRRIDLKELIVDYKQTTSIILSQGISDDSYFFSIPDDVLQIKFESAIVTSGNCGNIEADVKPKTLDEYNIQRKNPFKKPDKTVVWRMDYNSIEPGQNVVELISSLPIVRYNMRYLKCPTPIILTDLNDGDFLDSGLSINGQTNEQTSSLHKSVHTEIVREAVELATASYKEDSLNNILALYNKKE